MNIFRIIRVSLELIPNFLWIVILCPFELLKLLSRLLFGDGFTAKKFFHPVSLISHLGFGWLMADAYLTRKTIVPDRSPISIFMFRDIFSTKILSYHLGFKTWAITILMFAFIFLIIRFIGKALHLAGKDLEEVTPVTNSFEHAMISFKFKLKQLSWMGSRTAYVKKRVSKFRESQMYLKR